MRQAGVKDKFEELLSVSNSSQKVLAANPYFVSEPTFCQQNALARKRTNKATRSSLKANCKMNLPPTGPFSLIAQQASPAFPFFYYT